MLTPFPVFATFLKLLLEAPEEDKDNSDNDDSLNDNTTRRTCQHDHCQCTEPDSSL